MTWHEHWERGSPEHITSRNEVRESSFEERVLHVTAERVVQILAIDKGLAKKLEAKGFPVDEATCDDIGASIGLGAEEIAAASRYLSSQKRYGMH